MYTVQDSRDSEHVKSADRNSVKLAATQAESRCRNSPSTSVAEIFPPLERLALEVCLLRCSYRDEFAAEGETWFNMQTSCIREKCSLSDMLMNPLHSRIEQITKISFAKMFIDEVAMDNSHQRDLKWECKGASNSMHCNNLWSEVRVGRMRLKQAQHPQPAQTQSRQLNVYPNVGQEN